MNTTENANQGNVVIDDPFDPFGSYKKSGKPTNSPRYEDCYLVDGSRLISIEVPGYAVSELSVSLGDVGQIYISGKRKNIQTKKVMWSNTEHRHNTEFSMVVNLEHEDEDFYISDVYLIKAILYISVNYRKKFPKIESKSFKINEIL